ncbi:MAG: hypothetical protein K6F65_08535 [Lachnospiraceae bacterium]|nr:hypothetical protein [Lachnospiraceae bacterium]
MTEKVYERQSFLKELETIVTESTCEDGQFYVKLKETILFPEEGGQYSDAGFLLYGDRKVSVLNGELIGNASEGDTDIRYAVDCEIPAGSSVRCVLDWKTRFSRMQNHSGEHIVSGLIHNLYGYDNIGFHLSDDEPVTLTVSGKLSAEQIREIEIRANKAVYEDLPITDSYPSREELASMEYRSKIEIAGQVRLITIGDPGSPLDVCACCAPHVARTGSIGIIKVISFASVKGGTQLSILCGLRALEFIEKNIDNLESLAKSFSTHRDNVPGIAESLRDENRVLKAKLSEYAEKAILSGITDDGPGCIFTDMELSPVSMKNIFNELTARKSGYVGIFAGNDQKGYMYYAGGRGLDARELAKLMREKLSSKGGGSAEMIQGRTSSAQDEITGFWVEICLKT